MALGAEQKSVIWLALREVSAMSVVGVALVSSYLPASRAARSAPTSALRYGCSIIAS